MIQKNKHLKEYWYVNHRNDDLKHTGFDYENNLFRKLFSGLMFDNPKLNEFLTKLQEMVDVRINIGCQKFLELHSR
jgi:hypothetical protein